MLFKDFAKILDDIEKVSSRNELTKMLADLISQLNAEEIRPAMYFLQGRLAPKYVDIEFNMSRKLVLKSLDQISNNSATKLFKEVGDAGKASELLKESFSAQSISLFDSVMNVSSYDSRQNDKEILQNNLQSQESGKEITINYVFTKLKQIAKEEGSGSQERKLSLFVELYKKVDPLSIRFITRIIVGELRLGVSDKTILDSFSWFLSGDKSMRKLFDTAYGSRADIGEIAFIIKTSKNPEQELKNIKLKPGVPIASKLVERESSPGKVWERMPDCFVQPKLDGLRGQLHYDKKNNIKEIYSRNMENLTSNFPELLAALEELGVDSIILDSEIVGFDEENKKYFTYQETMQRRRKYDVEDYSKKFPVRAMCFDVLYFNGQDLTQRPIGERLKILKDLLEGSLSSLRMLETIQMQTANELADYFEKCVGDGLEGIIAKEPQSFYEPGTRNFSWIKLKANTKSELVDTIDVAVIGYYVGRGQRAKFGVGALLSAVYDPYTDTYYSIGKVGSGMTDEMLEKIKKELDQLKTERKPKNYDVDSTLTPDFWVEPKIIVEIVADEITRSPNHTAAKGIKTKVLKDKPERGLSVRFPRIKIWGRDKDYPSTVQEIVRMYELRKGMKN
ncbi:MAG: ATP-dependent DNA ligase [Candidatus Dojkabacteria bacterium]